MRNMLKDRGWERQSDGFIKGNVGIFPVHGGLWEVWHNTDCWEPVDPKIVIRPRETMRLTVLTAMAEAERIAAGRRKPLLCLDFDGVIHSYTSGWEAAHIVNDPPVPGTIDFLRKAVQRFRVAVYSSRSNAPGGIEAMSHWLMQHVAKVDADVTWAHAIEWPLEKPSAMVTIDDRALTFSGEWSDYPLDRLLRFRPWNKR